MKRKSNVTVCLCLGALSLLLFVAFGSTIARADARTDIQDTLNKLVDVAEEYPGEDHQVARRAAMRKIIEPRFDFEEMAKRSLGVQWKSISESEQTRFVEVFSELLATTYLGKIDMLERNMVEIKEQKQRENKAFVQTDVTYKGDTFGLDYKLIDRNGIWKVYDVIIENIGLVANYRNEFAGIMRKEKFAGLLERLEKKVDGPVAVSQ